MCCQVPWLVEEGAPSALVWGGNVELVVANRFFSEAVQQDLAQVRCFGVTRWDNPGNTWKTKGGGCSQPFSKGRDLAPRSPLELVERNRGAGPGVMESICSVTWGDQPPSLLL